jgi:hypothetical protein
VVVISIILWSAPYLSSNKALAQPIVFTSPTYGPPTSQQTRPTGADSLPQLGTGSAWTDICNLVRNALYNSCGTYVNSDSSLNARGLHAFECRRNGLILAGTGEPFIFFLLRSINHG